jgi:hypothetical protein
MLWSPPGVRRNGSTAAGPPRTEVHVDGVEPKLLGVSDA